MRYLYADSSPFGPEYDFLGALQSFVTHAARAAQLDAEVRALRRATSDARGARAQSMNALSAFHDVAMRALREGLEESPGGATDEYVKLVSEHAVQIVLQMRSAANQKNAVEEQKAALEIERRHAEIRAALGALLTPVRLPSVRTSISARLAQSPYEATAVFTHADGVVASFTLSTKDSPEWAAPRKVADFVAGIELPVGVKRSWFSKGVQHEMTNIAELIVGGFELSDDDAQIRLRKRAADKDSIVFEIHRSGAKLKAEVHYPDDAEAEGVPTPLDAQALGQIERLWDVIRQRVSELLVHKERLLSVTMGGADVCGEDRVAPLIESVVRQLAPAVTEIARRGSNPQELTLKRESDDGRREEIYVKRSELASKLAPLGDVEKRLFLPLALTGGGTLPPPPLSTKSLTPPPPPASRPSAAPPLPVAPSSSGESPVVVAIDDAHVDADDSEDVAIETR